jgi:probable O-glycosylation ligase (exosortase A-associated)
MRDITLLIMLLTLAWMAWRQPWVGVLGLVFVGVMHPQGYATDFMRSFPAYFALLIVVAFSGGWHLFRQRAWPQRFWDWRLGLVVLLWIWFICSTYFAINPLPARDKLLEVTKLLPELLLVLLFINTPEKLRWLLLTIAFSLAVVVLKGGYWAVITGFHDRVYGPPGSPYGGNNEFAVATTIAIPLLVMWFRSLDSRWPRWAVGMLIFLSFASALSSWSRGGLLSLGAVSLLLVWHSRRKWLAIPLLLAGVGLVFVGLPEAWFARMGTMGAPELEGSAASRLTIWRIGWDYALQHPWFGSGFESWVLFTPPDAEFRAWHSAYVQMAVEHGLVGFGLWGLLLGGTLVNLSRLIGQGRRQSMPWLVDQAASLRTALVAYMVGAAFLSIAYWELLYLLITAAIVLQYVMWLAHNPNRGPGARLSEFFTVTSDSNGQYPLRP